MTVCNWCGIESKSDLVCDWCKRPLSLRSTRVGLNPDGTPKYGTDYLKDGDDTPTPGKTVAIVLGAVALVGLLIGAIFFLAASGPSAQPVASNTGEGTIQASDPSAPNPNQAFAVRTVPNSNVGSTVAPAPINGFIAGDKEPGLRTVSSANGAQNNGRQETFIEFGKLGAGPRADVAHQIALTPNLHIVSVGGGKARIIGLLTVNNTSDSSVVELRIEARFARNTIPFEAFQGTTSSPRTVGMPTIPANSSVQIPIYSKPFTGRPGRLPAGTLVVQSINDSTSGVIQSTAPLP